MSYCTDATWVGRSDCQHCDIRGTMLFSELQERELGDLLRPVDNLRLAAKSSLYHEGEVGDAVFTVRKGLVRLVHYAPNGTRRIVRLLKSGSVIGMEVLVNTHYHHCAEAVSDTDLCRIPVEVITQLEGRNPALHTALMRRWQNSLDDADMVITQLSTGSSHARVARFLLLVAIDPHRTECHHLMREDIAALLGLTVETVSRVFAEFKRNGWLVEGADCPRINPQALERVATD
ncbi:MAG: Crp/Fnr family transcriptional regulator [Burkholderiales bacterium]|nr:Crp/Fnr family transcriptional regulator [Burkholderiales bacterium]